MNRQVKHTHRNVSIREDDYNYLNEVASMLQIRDKRRTSLCDAVNWLVLQAKTLKVTLPPSSELKVAKK